MKRLLLFVFGAGCLFFAGLGFSAMGFSAMNSSTTPPHVLDQPVELGKVQWSRDLEQAKRQASQSKKPIFVLFQEVPG